MTDLTDTLANFAASRHLTPAEAVYLPAIVAVIAREGRFPESEAAWRLQTNPALGDWAIDTIRRIEWLTPA